MQTICHLSVLVHKQAKKYGDREAIIYKDFGGDKWKSISWNEFSLRVKQVSNALLNIGAKPQENIAVFAQNSLDFSVPTSVPTACACAASRSTPQAANSRYST